MRWFASLVLALALGVMGCNEASGTGGFPCTEQGIRDAIAEGGGPHEFACNAPTVVPEYFRIRNDVILDGGGLLTTDGWDIASGVSAELHGFTIRDQTVRADGGGVTNEGTLLIRDSSVSGFDGSGVSNSGTLRLVRSTVTGNGGGISNFGVADVINSTVSGNTIYQEFSNSGAGVHNSGRLTITQSTISNNADYFREEGPSGLYNSEDATLVITNSIVDGTCGGAITSNGYNIESPGDTCGFDQVNVSADDLKLGELTDNGGPTETHALGAGSVAIDVIPQDDCVDAEGAPLTTDQREQPRPDSGYTMCDVGAFEVQP